MFILSLLLVQLSLTAAVPHDLGDYFGFNDLEIIKIGPNPGPMYTGDVNGDGLIDIIVINNRKSRIEVLLQKVGASPADIVEVKRANEIPEHWRFKKKHIMVAHQISAIALHDFNDDGRTDIIYAGNPGNIVFLEQEGNGEFKKTRTHRIRNLSANRNAFTILDIIGDEGPELITIVNRHIHIYPINGDAIGKATVLATESRSLAFELADYDGNGLQDIVGIIPDSSEPVRLWLAHETNGIRSMGPQLRFEMPPVREFTAITLPNRKAAVMAVIERASRRIVLYEVDRETIESSGDREASIEVYSFLGDGKRKQLIVDVNSDGLLDLVATNPSDNTIVAYMQQKDEGLTTGTPSPTLSKVDSIATCDLDGDGSQELFVLSEDEGVVGRLTMKGPKLPFPKPIPFTSGNTPTSLSAIKFKDQIKIAIISRLSRMYTIDLLDNTGKTERIFNESLSRGPDEIIGFDADQDGRTDLLLLTRDKPMKMLQGTDVGVGFTIIDGEDMGQYGLVREASKDNTAIFDVDQDGLPELLIAGDNFVRAVRYEPSTEPGISPGWQVITQVNMEDGGSDLVSITVSGRTIFVADKKNERIVQIVQDTDGNWVESDSLYVHGYELGAIYAADFTADGVDDIVAIGETGFAIIQLSGKRITINEMQSWRSENDRRMQHEFATGDVNNDGFIDLISLDAGEQMLEIFTFSEASKMLYATGFKIFESRIFSGGESREWQPSQAIVTDLTNDGLQDILLLAHDRLLLYPQ